MNPQDYQGRTSKTDQSPALSLCAAWRELLAGRCVGRVFRYFYVFDEIADFRTPWRKALGWRLSVRVAVSAGYPGCFGSL
jgi:hypothetical protein